MDQVAAAEAAALAGGAADIDALRAALEGFKGDELRGSARHLVFAAGRPDAPLMVVGDVPDRDEDAEGMPFAGSAGRLFDRMLAAIDLTRDDAYLTTALPWRTLGQRAPTPQERACLRPFLMRHIALAAPRALLLMGGTACDFTLEKRFTSVRGRWEVAAAGEREVAALATFHPGLLLAQGEQKRLAWRDLQQLRTHLDG